MNTHSFSAVHSRINLDSNGRASGAFQDFTVSSAFQPIYSLSHKDPVGYEALCRPRLEDGSVVSPLDLFGQAHIEADAVLIDRLCRAIHVQNFAASTDKKSWIFLNVNPAVTVVGKNYGHFFKEMLARNNILPGRVVIEILEQNIQDESILSAAVEYYKELGCLVAVDDFGAAHSNFDRIWSIQPDIVKFDRSIIVQAEASRMTRKALPSLVSLIQELGCIALVEGIETEQQALIAIDSNVDLVQGYYFGRPKAELVDLIAQDSTLSQLRDKHTEFSVAIEKRYRKMVDQCLVEFGAVLQNLKTGCEANLRECGKLLSLPNVTRIFFLDETGCQIGENLSSKPLPERTDPRYRPLAEATDANWSRRNYFRQALLNPGEVQMTRPYRSLVGKSQCVTLSALIESQGGKLVACLDLDWP